MPLAELNLDVSVDVLFDAGSGICLFCQLFWNLDDDCHLLLAASWAAVLGSVPTQR